MSKRDDELLLEKAQKLANEWAAPEEWELAAMRNYLDKLVSQSSRLWGNKAKSRAGSKVTADIAELEAILTSKLREQGSDLGLTEAAITFKGLEMSNSKSKRDRPLTSLSHRRDDCLVYYPRSSPEGPYRDNTVHVGFQRHANVHELLARFFLKVHFHQQRISNWRDLCIGITSHIQQRPWRAPNGQTIEAHMPMFDYDGKNIKTLIRRDVKKLQKEAGLGPAWVYRTKRGFHVYFFTDIVSKGEFLKMLDMVKCCKGFKASVKRHGRAVLRLSAKYTEFDIKFEYVLEPEQAGDMPRRKHQKAHVIEYLLRLGQECGTHFASLFPQWANFMEDPEPWKPAPRNRRRKPGSRKVKKIPSAAAQAFGQVYVEVQPKYKHQVWYTTTSTTSNSGW